MDNKSLMYFNMTNELKQSKQTEIQNSKITTTEIKGSKNSALVFTDIIEEKAYRQIETLLNQDLFVGSQIRIMNDCHYGAGCVIGFTAKVKDAIVPNLVGVDISCSISGYKLNTDFIDYKQLDIHIKEGLVPSGLNTRREVSEIIPDSLKEEIEEVNKIIDTKDKVKGYTQRDLLFIGTLGGGNHFIEIDKDNKGNYWLLLHSGSRNFGKRICDFYQKKARQKCKYEGDLMSDLSYIEGKDLEDYIYCSKIANKFAEMNHEVMAHEILQYLNSNTLNEVKITNEIHTKHNYIEFLDNDEMMIRKGAVSAKNKEQLLIPVNMSYGTLIAVGKGNDNRNQSAPHGAGRILSRTQAKKQLSIDKMREQMEGIYTTSLSEKTLDEAPDAYKPVDNLLYNLDDTCEITNIIKPVYNFKAE